LIPVKVAFMWRAGIRLWPRDGVEDMRKVRQPVEVTEETREFHRRCLVVDLHTDSLMYARILGLDLSKRHRAPRGISSWKLHTDVPKLKEGGVDAVFFGIVTHPWPRKAFSRALRSIDYARYVFDKNREDLVFANAPADIEAAHKAGKVAALLGVEGMHMLGGRLERIEELYSLGVRYLTMAHFTSNRFAVSSADSTKGHAELGALGTEAVRTMNELGMMIDVSHTHADLITEVCRLSSQPVIVSHGAAEALRPTFRNLTDEDIENIAGTGGVIGLIYSSEWLAPRRSRPHLSVVVDHADYIKRLVGVDHLSLGSDWDGLITTPDGMRDATDLPALTQLFFDRGYDADEVEKILGMNFIRVFRQVSKGGSTQ
jgi:membrane dipeptidase